MVGLKMMGGKADTELFNATDTKFLISRCCLENTLRSLQETQFSPLLLSWTPVLYLSHLHNLPLPHSPSQEICSGNLPLLQLSSRPSRASALVTRTLLCWG